VRQTPLIVVQNESTVLTDAEVQNAIPAFQAAVAYDFRPYWDAGATLVFGVSPVPAGAWVYVIRDDSDQPGALAYHDVDQSDTPVMFNFAKTEQHYGSSWTVGFTHELFETLADPDIRGAEEQDDGSFYAREVCDPVEDDALAYTRKGKDGSPILISDFVTWHWFSSKAPGPYDFKGHCTKPGQILPGGYMSVFRNGRWGTVQAQKDGAVRPLTSEEEGQLRSGRVNRLALHRNRVRGHTHPGEERDEHTRPAR
jgi:hypothetical protein